jgi:uncharacterized membrane protein
MTRKRISGESIMVKQPQPQNEQSAIAKYERYNEVDQDYLPDPVILEGFKKIDPSFAKLVMQMAKDHNDADVKTKNRRSLSELIVPIIGQVLTFLLGAGGILTCIYLAKAGYTGPAIATVAGGFLPIIINAFRNFRSKT